MYNKSFPTFKTYLSEDVVGGPIPDEITYNGYTTKNLHHSEDARRAFLATIDRANKGQIHDDSAAILDALKATDTYMKINDLHLEQGKAPDDEEVKQWLAAHHLAREKLHHVGEFMHHMDYWHMHEHELQDELTPYNLETAGAEMADSYTPEGNPINESMWRVEKSEATGRHHVVRGYNNKRELWTNKIGAGDFAKEDDAKKKAEELNNMKEDLGLNEVSSTTLKSYMSKVSADSQKHRADPTKRSPKKASKSVMGFAQAASKLAKEETTIDEELTDKTIKSNDKIKVARVIADMLGVDKAESMSPDSAVSAGLRKVKSKRMTPEMLGVLNKMLDLARQVGIKVDKSTLPAAMAEDVVDKDSTYNAAKGILRFDDFVKLSKINQGIVPVAGETLNSRAAGEDQTETGHTLDGQEDKDHLRRMKAKYRTEESSIEEDLASADYRTSPSGRKSRAHRIDFKNSSMSDMTTDADNDESKRKIKAAAAVKVMEEIEPDLSDDDLDKLANDVDDIDDIIDVYEDEELKIVDDETGEEVKDEVNEQVLNEVLSRMERMRAKMRFLRTASKRARRMKIVLHRHSDMKTITKRARRLAINLIKQRMMKKPVSQMSVAEKERAEAIIAKRKAVVDRLAMRLVPRIRKIENDRLSHTKGAQSAPPSPGM